jgi:hypothetical protein
MILPRKNDLSSIYTYTFLAKNSESILTVGHALLKLTNYTTMYSTNFNRSGMRFEARTCYWMLHFVRGTFGVAMFFGSQIQHNPL